MTHARCWRWDGVGWADAYRVLSGIGENRGDASEQGRDQGDNLDANGLHVGSGDFVGVVVFAEADT